MIKNFEFEDFYNPYKGFKRSDLGSRLARLQRLVSEFDMPVLIIIDGWESSGKGYVINDLMRELEPRSSKVQLFDKPTKKESASPSLGRFWKKIPKKGHISIYDRSYYSDIMNDPNISEDDLECKIEDIKNMEKQLFDDNTIIIKFFLHLTKETQKERIEKLQYNDFSEFLVSDDDVKQNNEYEKNLNHFNKILNKSNFKFTPWHIIPTENRKDASKFVLGKSIDFIQSSVDVFFAKSKQSNKNGKTMVYPDILGNLDQTLSITDEYYDDNLNKLQKEAAEIAFQFFINQIPCVLAFEGMDAAGKGGAIDRLTRFMDPRGYEVVTTSAPDQTESSHHYLWRFYNKFPNNGRIAIFDRSWYGRVMVERIEGFATFDEWSRAFGEINQMEKHLTNCGSLVLKFFICIDNAEQLQRFNDREQEADKLYKITDEDWRNRDKWDEYIIAMNEMLARTDTEYAPWVVVEGNDKQHARIKVLKSFIEYGQKFLEDFWSNY